MYILSVCRAVVSNMRIYTPNTIYMPRELKEHPAVHPHLLNYFDTLRHTPHNRNVVDLWIPPDKDTPKESLLNLEEKREMLFAGQHPLFHDIFVRETPAGQQLIALGIEDECVKRLIGEVELWHKGKQLRFTYGTDPKSRLLLRLYLIGADAQTHYQAGDALELRWTQGDLSFSHTIYLQTYPWEQDADVAKLTLQTMQKDEPLEWIHDWILYHHRIHNVERILLYDNGSRNQEALIELLMSLESETLEICFIPWHISYAPTPLTECQVAGLTHAYYWLWDQISWIIYCDIDEYLINRTGVTLQEYFCHSSTYANPVLALPTVTVASFHYEKEEHVSALDFQYTYNSYTNYKSVSRGAEDICIENPHTIRPCTGLLRGLFQLSMRRYQHIKKSLLIRSKRRKPSSLRTLLYFLSSYYNLWQAGKGQSTKTMKGKVLQILCYAIHLLPVSIKKAFLSCRHKEWGLYFYDYAGLNSNWKEQRTVKASPPGTPPPAHTVKDEQIVQLLRKAGVGQYDSK